MKETLKRDFNKIYLILTSEDKSYEESYEIEMIVKNSPKTILPLHVLRVDGALQLCYDISSKQTLGECVNRAKINAATIGALFQAIDELKEEIREYLLDMESVILDLNHIYVQEGCFYFCYCPWEKQEVLKSFRNMLEEILGNLDYHDTEGVELAYHLYQNTCRGDFCIPEILEEHRKEKSWQKEETDISYTPYEEEFQEEISDAAQIKADNQKQKKKPGILRRIVQFFMKKEKTEPEDAPVHLPESHDEFFYKADWKESGTQVLETANGDTVVLGSMPAGKWKLRPLLPGYEEFCITEENFFIGKKRDSIDGYIGRDTISRIHSRLVVRQGHLLIADENSTNGTFVNGVAIEPGKDVEIFQGDRILFADVEYECYNSL